MSQNAVIGESYGTDLPQTDVPQNELDNEKKLAKFSKTAEFKRLKTHLEERKQFYQQFLPDGRAISEVPKQDLEGMWMVANAIIGEFNFIIQRYESANEVVNATQLKND